MEKRFEKDKFIDEISEGIFDKLAKGITGLGKKITRPQEPTMLTPMKQRISQYPKTKERKIPSLPSNSPESKVREGGTSLMRPDLVRKIWTKKKVEPQQKEFFINVFAKDPEAISYLKQGIKRVLCGDVQIDKIDFTQFDSGIIQFVNSGILQPSYKDLSKKVYDILYGKSKGEHTREDLSGFCSQLTETKALYASLLELGPSAQGLGSYDERFELSTGIDRAEDSGLLNFSDTMDNDNCNKHDNEEEITSKISP